MIARRRRLAHRRDVEVIPAVNDVALLLPWYATGSLDDRAAGRVAAAVRADRKLAAQLAEISRECVEIVALDSQLGAPSPRALHRLFAAIDAEQGRPLPSGPTVRVLRPDRLAGSTPRHCTSKTVAKKIGCCV